MSESEVQWYVADGGETPLGPFAERDIDVRFRTNELTSAHFAWSEQLGGDWKPIHEIPQLRALLQQSMEEVTPDIQKELPQPEEKEKNDKEEQQEPNQDDAEDAQLGENVYYNKQEKAYKIFDGQTWITSESKPSAEMLASFPQVEELKLSEGEAQDDEKDEPEQKVISEEDLKKKEMRKLKRKRALVNKKKRWFETQNNTFVYMQGLPTDITQEELETFAKKCGVLRIDQNTGGAKIKIYVDRETGNPKGDARICYANAESVGMAMDWLNESHIRPGFPVKVEQATFEQKGEEYRPREVQKIDKIEKMRIKAQQERQNAWDESQMHEIGLKIVCLEDFYTLEEVQQCQTAYQNLEDPVAKFFKDLELELKEEIEQKIGPIDKVEFYQEKPVAKIKFQSAIHAESCIKLMNDRYFSYRQLRCYFWDGKTDYKRVKEADNVLEDRIEKFGDWLEGQELDGELEGQTLDQEMEGQELDQELDTRKRDVKADEKGKSIEAEEKGKSIALQDLEEESL